MDAILIDEVNNKINENSNVIINNLNTNITTLAYYPYSPQSSQNKYSTLPIQFIPEYSGIVRCEGYGSGYVSINNVGISIPPDPEDEFLMDIPVIKNEPLIIDYVYDDEDESPLGEMYDVNIYFSKGIGNPVYSNYASNYTNSTLINNMKRWEFPIYNIGNFEVYIKECLTPFDGVTYNYQLIFYTNINGTINPINETNLYVNGIVEYKTFNINISNPTILYAILRCVDMVVGGTENLESFINIKYIN